MRRLSEPPRRHESSRKGVDPNCLSCPVSRSSNIIISILASSHISSNLGVLAFDESFCGAGIALKLPALRGWKQLLIPMTDGLRVYSTLAILFALLYPIDR